MARLTKLRLLLAVLLVWQLGTGTWVHASPLSAVGPSGLPASAAHCSSHHHATPAQQAGDTRSADSEDGNYPSDTQDCCTQGTCACDCIGAALPPAVNVVAKVTPDHQTLVAFVIASFTRRVSTVFRPPI